MKIRPPGRARGGFSTIDALVGLTILSLSLSLALGAQANARRVAERARETRAAGVLLQSLDTIALGSAQSAHGVSGVLIWRVSEARSDVEGLVPLCLLTAEV